MQPYVIDLLWNNKQVTNSVMQKWQQKQKLKAHQLKIENAKSSIRKYSGSREKAPNSGRAKSNQGNRSANINTPIDKILEIFQLEQYGPLLASYGFPQKLTEKKSLEYLDQMIDGVKQKDKEKFLSLINTLTVMSKDIRKQVKTPKSTSKPNKVHYPPAPSTSMQSRNPPNSAQKSQKTTVKFRVKQKNTINSLMGSKGSVNKISKQHVSKKTEKTRENSIETDKRPKKSFSSRAVDDLSLIHDFTLCNNDESGILRPINESNKIIQKLTQKLAQIDPSSVNPTSGQLNLEMDKIKQMYLSFDSATITSNIINIDLHEMIECLAMETRHLITSAQVNILAKSHADKIKSLLHQSFVLHRTESKQVRNQEQNQCLPMKYLKNSISQIQQADQLGSPDNTSIPKFQQMREIDLHDEQNRNITIQNQYDTDRSSNDIEVGQDSQNCSIDLNRNMKQSSLWGNSYIASVINDFSCFDSLTDNNNSGTEVMAPKEEEIRSFIQLVVMAGRMEKQVPIIAFVYLKRLLSVAMVKQAKITSKNWRNLLLVTLIQASKIWDDQSLENHSFAKLIKPYTTLEINRLQKYLVYFLDYRLTIDQKQYSEAYFRLRRHIGEKQSIKSANLMRLDLKTIQKLQSSGLYGFPSGKSKNNISSVQDKKDYFKRLLNKSF